MNLAVRQRPRQRRARHSAAIDRAAAPLRRPSRSINRDPQGKGFPDLKDGDEEEDDNDDLYLFWLWGTRAECAQRRGFHGVSRHDHKTDGSECEFLIGSPLTALRSSRDRRKDKTFPPTQVSLILWAGRDNSSPEMMVDGQFPPFPSPIYARDM